VTGPVILLIFIFIWFFREHRLHQRALSQIPLRIHVNGTRGKSSVTRLIAAGLRVDAKRVFAKTTGTAPRIIECDGSEKEWPRRGPANIRELVDIVRIAAAQKTEILVVECMALRPELQWFSEHRLLQSHIGVLTNIRPDHLDVMGHDLQTITAALANTIPGKGCMVTTQEALETLNSWGSQIHHANWEIVSSTDSVAVETASTFPYEVHPANLALALKVCELAGVSANTALEGMRQAAPDLGNVTISTFHHAGKSVRFINALAANDPLSTLELWQRYVEPVRANTDSSEVILLNMRSDRRFRTLQLISALTAIHAGPYWVVGDSDFTKGQLRKAGISQEMIHSGEKTTTWRHLIETHPAAKFTLFAAGNTKGFLTPPCMFSSSAL